MSATCRWPLLYVRSLSLGPTLINFYPVLINVIDGPLTPTDNTGVVSRSPEFGRPSALAEDAMSSRLCAARDAATSL